MGEKIIKVGVKKEPGYLYYIDKDGDVARAKMIRGGKRKEASAVPVQNAEEPKPAVEEQP